MAWAVWYARNGYGNSFSIFIKISLYTTPIHTFLFLLSQIPGKINPWGPARLLFLFLRKWKKDARKQAPGSPSMASAFSTFLRIKIKAEERRKDCMTDCHTVISSSSHYFVRIAILVVLVSSRFLTSSSGLLSLSLSHSFSLPAALFRIILFKFSPNLSYIKIVSQSPERAPAIPWPWLRLRLKLRSTKWDGGWMGEWESWCELRVDLSEWK